MSYHGKQVENGWEIIRETPKPKKREKRYPQFLLLSVSVGVLFVGCVFPWGEQKNPAEAVPANAVGQVVVLNDYADAFHEVKPEFEAVEESPADVEDVFEAEKIEAALLERGYLREDIPLSYTEQDLLHTAADEFGVDYYLMVALIERETDFRNIYGDGGAAYGYCQIWPLWWADLMEEIGVDDLNDPYDNFRAGCAILSLLIERHGSVEYALTAYNRGTPGESEYSKEIMERAEVWRNG